MVWVGVDDDRWYRPTDQENYAFRQHINENKIKKDWSDDQLKVAIEKEKQTIQEGFGLTLDTV